MNLPSLNFPPANLRIRHHNGQRQVFDRVRKVHLLLTPEEWVRQNIIHFLIEEKKFPEGLMEIEKNIRVHNTEKRVDILVRDKNLQPLLLVECKAPGVELRQEQVDQLARYQVTLKAPYSMLSNGLRHFVLHHSNGNVVFLNELPVYNQITEGPFN